MSTSRNNETPVGITPADIYFVVFRHKWKIITLTLLGLVGAAIYYFTCQPPYQSEAKIFIRYITERTANSADPNQRVTSLTDMGQNIMNSEMEILTSYDLAAKAATNYGPEKILAKLGGGNNVAVAAAVVKSHLRVEGTKDSSVIYVTFSHVDPDVVRPVLTEIIADYQDMHVRVHRNIGISEETLQDKITQWQLEIRQTEDELRVAKTNAGIISVEDSAKFYQEEISRLRRELSEAKANYFEFQNFAQTPGTTNEPAPAQTNLMAGVPAEQIARYKTLCARLAALEKQQAAYIQQGLTDESTPVQENHTQLVATTKAKQDLEQRYPVLAKPENSMVLTGGSPTPSGPSTAQLQIMSLPMRINILEQQLAEIQAEALKLSEAEAKIAHLERKKKEQEATYQYYTMLQNQSRIDDQLGPNRANISQIQFPSPPGKNYSKFYKAIGMLAFGGLLAGLAWAFLIEFYFDRTIKRPVDFQTKLRIPYFLSIPDLNHNARRWRAAAARRELAAGDVAAAAPATNGAVAVVAPLINHALHSHYDALRDRLVNYFESINLTRKPKLVAVTSTAKGAGVSTISAGLAASLSETGDGRVLLVDMNRENGAAQQFVRGQADCKLDDALASEKRDHALVQENLYVVSEGSGADSLPRVLPKRFASLVPKLKASDYDYIIFDMPPVTQTSVTTRLAGFMDTVMLVVESEKTDRDSVAQANQLLLQSKANVTAVLNKTRSYVPARLAHDLNAEV